MGTNHKSRKIIAQVENFFQKIQKIFLKKLKKALHIENDCGTMPFVSAETKADVIVVALQAMMRKVACGLRSLTIW